MPARGLRSYRRSRRAASRELQQARRERKYNPADVDAVIADLDRLILARDRKALTAPSSMWEK